MTASTITKPPRTEPKKPVPPLFSAMMQLLYLAATNVHRAVEVPLARFRGYQLRRHGHVVEVKTPFDVIAHQKEGYESHCEGNTAEQQAQNPKTILVRHVQSTMCVFVAIRPVLAPSAKQRRRWIPVPANA